MQIWTYTWTALNGGLNDTLTNTDKLYQYRMMIYCAITDIPEHWKLYQYRTLIHCAITLNTVPVWNIDKLCNYGYSWTLMSDAIMGY